MFRFKYRPKLRSFSLFNSEGPCKFSAVKKTIQTGKILEFKLKRGLPAYMGTVTFVSIGLLFIIILPIFLFMYMEGWNFLDALYFMMISLSTIGL